MATVQAVLDRKGNQVFTIAPDDTVLAAAELMNQRAVGGLVVVDRGQVAGIFTERDILRRVVALRRDPARTLVREVMTAPVAFCRPDTALAETRALMTDKRIRHLPVIDTDGLCGIVTIGDMLAHEMSERDSTIEYLTEYIHSAH